MKEQLFGWSEPVSPDVNFEDSDESRTSQSSEASNEELSQNVPKRLADLRNQLSNKQYALTAAKEAGTFDEKVSFNSRA